MKPLPCAVLGTGRIGSSLETDRLREKPASHAGAISRNPHTILVGGADPDPERLAAFGRQWKLKPRALFSDAAQLLETLHPGIVHIAADTDAHTRLLETCIQARVPVIVLEKPVGASLEDARTILPLTLASESGQDGLCSRIVVNHERRFAADYNRARELIRAQAFGTLLSVHARLFMGRTRDTASVLWHDGTHMADIIGFLAGPWEPVHVQGKCGPDAGNLTILGRTLAAEGQKPVDIVWETGQGRDHLVFELELGFACGRVRVGNGVYEEWASKPSRLYEHFRSLEPLTRLGKNPFHGRTGYFSRMMDHAVELHTNPRAEGRSTFVHGMAALEILARILELAGASQPT